MTNHLNHRGTKEFFKKNNYFGATESNVLFVKQEMTAMLNSSGKIQMATKNSLAMNSNGSGGILPAMQKNKGLMDLISTMDHV